jgi:lipid-binding SYLF domain-containing protein
MANIPYWSSVLRDDAAASRAIDQDFCEDDPIVAISKECSNNKTNTWTDTARQALQGLGLPQTINERRTAKRPSDLVVRVLRAQERVDLSGSSYTAYVILIQQMANQHTIEHRYSDFLKLHVLLQHYKVPVQERFPAKHWAGRMGNWTPSMNWAPKEHDDLIARRVVQLDAWLVAVIDQYNNDTLLPGPCGSAIFEFVTLKLAPCQQENLFAKDYWKWNNPFSCTLGSMLRQATRTLEYMTTTTAVASFDSSIPLDLLQAAKGLCFLTVAKAGLVVSGRVGGGLVVGRLDDGSWSAPCALGTVGMGWGAQIGGDVTHYLVVLTTEKAVEDLVSSSSVQLGAELDVAVGPLGRGAMGQIQTGDWTLHPAYSYAHSQGLFAGISLEGSVITVRNDINAKFYGEERRAQDLLRLRGPKAGAPLYECLDKAMGALIPDGSIRPSQWFSPDKDPNNNFCRIPSYTNEVYMSDDASGTSQSTFAPVTPTIGIPAYGNHRSG